MESTSNISETLALVVECYGNPIEVAELQRIPLKLLIKSNHVLLKVLCCNINPSDVYMVAGTYGVKHRLPQIFGVDLACEVIEVGSDVINVEVGDRVIPLSANSGGWQTHMIVEASALYKVKVPVPPSAIAQIRVNPLTAIQLLENFADLKSGDYLIQNGATSAVAIFVMQLCKKRGVNTINMFRSRKTVNANYLVKTCLTGYGATFAITDEELDEFAREHVDTKCKLGLSCLTGNNVSRLNMMMAPNSSILLYGSMDSQSIKLAANEIIFKSISVKGFAIHNWYMEHMNSGRLDLIYKEFDRILEMFHSGELQLNPIKEYSLKDWKLAFENSYFRTSIPEDITYKAMLKMN